ncbi:MAG: DUF6851 domain-containing protein, partial [Chitinophagaceae bacterium]
EKKLATRWNQLLLDAICFTKTSPPLAARAFAMVHTAMFDAWSVYDKFAISTSTAQYIKLPDTDCTKENRRKAFSFAAYRVLTDLFWLVLPPENRNMFRDLMCECNYNPDDTTIDCKTPQGIGNLSARMIIECRYGDGANQLGTLRLPNWSDYTCYAPINTWEKINDLNHWQPLRIQKQGEWKIQNFLVPHWGLVKPFALNNAAQFRPTAPAKKNTPEFFGQAAEVLHISECLTDKQKAIAEYWADGPGTFTPPGHWFEIAQFIAAKKEYGNSDCIRMYFLLGNAVLDAAIACWECKHFYDYVRPVTAIRELNRGKKIHAWGGPGKGTIEMNGEEWMPYQPMDFVTPPFPEHVSGHSTFSRAAATILRYYTGSDEFGGCTIVERGTSAIEPGITPKETITLEWPTFSSAAEEAGISRLYGGIHFQNGNQHGQKLGNDIADCVWKKGTFYFNN